MEGRPGRVRDPGRWAYWEELDFLAVFWGVPVIGVSGLMLWFPERVTTRRCWRRRSSSCATSSTCNLRPEAYPLDPVMFLGALPLERLREERPVEHERLAASGELEKSIVPPPSREAVRRAYRFGVTTLLVGLVLTGFLLAAAVDVLAK